MTEQPHPGRKFLMDALNENGPGQAFVTVHQCVPSCREDGCRSYYDTTADILLADLGWIIGGAVTAEAFDAVADVLAQVLTSAGRLVVITDTPPPNAEQVATRYKMRGGEVVNKRLSRMPCPERQVARR